MMAIEGLWVSPGGKTPASTLYAALSRSVKELGKEFAVPEGGAGEVCGEDCGEGVADL